MGTINLTQGNDHRLRVEMTRWNEPLALSHSSDVHVYAISWVGQKTQLVVHYSSQDEGVLEAEWPSILGAGSYGLMVTGVIEGEGQWTMMAANAVKVTYATEKGGEKVEMTADSFDVKATITVCKGTTGVTEELRQVIADMIEEEYMATERVRESNEHDRIEAETLREQKEGERQQAEGQRGENEQQRQGNEQTRQENEQQRERAEGDRQSTFEQNEVHRQNDYELAEQNRGQAYNQAETLRDDAYRQAEQDRDTHYQSAEGARNTLYQQAESDRNNAFQGSEQTRNQKEEERQQAEQLRQQAEQNRVNAENLRVQNEQNREQAEQGRVQAETQRETTFATYRPLIDQKLDTMSESEFDEIFN